MKKRRKSTYNKMSYTQQKAQQSLDDWVPKPVIPWEEKLSKRPTPGTAAYREWWKNLTHEQQEKALELRGREKGAEIT